MAVEVNKKCLFAFFLLIASVWNLCVQSTYNGDSIGFGIAGLIIALIMIIKEWINEKKTENMQDSENNLSDSE